MQKTLKFIEYIYINAIYAITEHKDLLMSSLTESLEQHDYLYDAVQRELDTPENSTIYKKFLDADINEIMQFITVDKKNIYPDMEESSFHDGVLGFAVPVSFDLANCVAYLKNK